MCKCMKVGTAKFVLVRPHARLPEYMTESSAACDVYIPEPVQIPPGGQVKVPLGLIAVPPFGFHWDLVIRSSIAKKNPGLRLSNCKGIIDADYSGPKDEIVAYLRNDNSENLYLFDQGMRLFQLELKQNIQPIQIVEINKADLFRKESRGGFGSTGEK